jgi:hypothetical protein
MRNTTTTQQLALDDALRLAQQRHIVLIPSARSVKLWAPGVRVPGAVRLAIMTNRREVRRLLGQAHVSVCCAPERHRASWDYINRRWCCDLCARLDYWLGQASERRTA